MKDSQPTSPPQPGQIVRLIASYRLLCGCFVYFSVQGGLIDSTRFFRPELYERCALVYTLGALLWLLLVLAWPRFVRQQYILHLSFDLALLGLICYYSGGATSDHTILPILSSAFSIAILPAMQALGVIATCIVILLGIETTLVLTTAWPASLFSAGVDGVAAIGLMPLLFWLNARMRRAQQSALSTHLDYQQLAGVNQDIINCMNTGCIIVDDRELIVHINPSAGALFATDADSCIGQNLATFSEQLSHIYRQEIQSGFHEARPLRLIGLDSYVLPHFLRLSRSGQTVILLDNLHQEIASIQQSRLATFGRMIHALMHEIKNPLATMEQALQRYSSDVGRPPGRRNGTPAWSEEIVPMLNRQIRRMVDIVQSTRNLLPNRKLEQEDIGVLEHIRAVVDEACCDQRSDGNLSPDCFDIDVAALTGLTTHFDPTHLRQILGNLIRNSAEHSRIDPDALRITVTGRRTARFVELEYWDNGVGIDANRREHIYKAFYSSDQEHAGLGLHISNELCQLNGAQLEYISLAVPARFRLSLPPASAH